MEHGLECSINKCKNCQVLEKKIRAYEKCLMEIKELDKNIDLTQSMILEKDLNGIRKTVKSDLTESFMVIEDEDGKTIDDLNKKEQNVIHEQDNLHNYLHAKTYMDKLSVPYTIISYALGIGKWFAFI